MLNFKFTRLIYAHRFLLFIFIFLLLFVPLLHNLYPKLSVVHPSPIKMNLTRAAWASFCNDKDFSVGFSTLEVFNRSNQNNKFKIYEENCSQKINQTIFSNSSEGRFVIDNIDKNLLIMAGLLPRVINYKIFQKNIVPKEIVNISNRGLWIHQAGIKGNKIAFTMSIGESTNFSSSSIFITDITNFNTLETNINCDHLKTSKYSGVQAIDLRNHIWFYASNPLKLMKANTAENSCSYRVIKSYPNHEVISFDVLQEESAKKYEELILYNKDTGFLRVREDLNGEYYETKNHRSNLINLDIFKTKTRTIKNNLYLNSVGKIKICSTTNCIDHPINEIMGVPIFQDGTRLEEKPLFFRNSTYGDLEVIFADDSKILFWIIGTKKVLLKTKYFEKLKEFNFDNISGADITSIVNINNRIVGSGYLTNAAIFEYDINSSTLNAYKDIVPHSQGQIETLAMDAEDNIYGAVYPKVNRFKLSNKFFDACTECRPNIHSSFSGPLKNYSQERPISNSSFIDKDQNLWVASKSDYSNEEVFSISKTNFNIKKTTAINSIDNNLPNIISMSNFDSNYLIFSSESINGSNLFKMDKGAMVFEKIHEFKNCKAVLGLTSSGFTDDKKIYIGCGKTLYSLNKENNITIESRSLLKIAKVMVTKNYVILLNKNLITRINKTTDSVDKKLSLLAFENFFQDDHWMPAAYEESNSVLYYANGEKLMKLDF